MKVASVPSKLCWHLLIAAAFLCAQVTATAHLLDHVDFEEQCTVCLVSKQVDHGCATPDDSALSLPEFGSLRVDLASPALAPISCQWPGQRAPPHSVPELH